MCEQKIEKNEIPCGLSEENEKRTTRELEISNVSNGSRGTGIRLRPRVPNPYTCWLLEIFFLYSGNSILTITGNGRAYQTNGRDGKKPENSTTLTMLIRHNVHPKKRGGKSSPNVDEKNEELPLPQLEQEQQQQQQQQPLFIVSMPDRLGSYIPRCIRAYVRKKRERK